MSVAQFNLSLCLFLSLSLSFSSLMFRTANLRQFLIDSESTSVSEHEPAYFENQAVWERVLVYRFLDTKNSNRFFRAFYFPGLSDRYVKYIRYFLLRNKNGNFVGV